MRLSQPWPAYAAVGVDTEASRETYGRRRHLNVQGCWSHQLVRGTRRMSCRSCYCGHKGPHYGYRLRAASGEV